MGKTYKFKKKYNENPTKIDKKFMGDLIYINKKWFWQSRHKT